MKEFTMNNLPSTPVLQAPRHTPQRHLTLPVSHTNFQRSFTHQQVDIPPPTPFAPTHTKGSTLKTRHLGNSPVSQWLGLCAFHC